MVGASRRKTRLPRKILRVKQDDGHVKLEPQENCYKSDDQMMESDDIPSPSSSPQSNDQYNDSFYDKYDTNRYNTAYVGGEYLKEATKLFLKSQTTSDYIVVQPSYDDQPPVISSEPDVKISSPPRDDHDVRDTREHGDRIKTYNPVKKQYYQKHHIPNLTKKHHHPEPTPDNPYQCETCDMLFKNLELLSDHQKTVHDNNRQFACRYCGKRFNDKYNMRKHVLIHVGEKRHKCQFCEKAFLRKDHLRSHLQTHYNRKYGCKLCGKSFKTIELYHRHVKTHKELDHLSEINNLENLLPELERYDSPKLDRYSPKLDRYDSPKLDRYDSPIPSSRPTHHHYTPAPEITRELIAPPVVKHERMNERLDDSRGEDSPWNRSGSPTYSDISGSSFSQSSPRGMDYGSANENTDVLKRVLSYRCGFCNATFEDKESVTIHERKCRAETQKWQCVKCNIVFDEPGTLKQHYEKVHSTEKPVQSPSRWRCKTCDINYPNSKELSRHYASAHKDAQIFPCSECPKTFTVWHNLKKHMLIHLGDKKHKCTVCDKGFVRKDHLNSHMKVHLGDGSKYTCPICMKVFRLKQMYIKHMNLHGLEQAQQPV
ncbi:zinc finger protein 184-like isoform X2 [Clytia hemisphaerica]